MKLYLDSVDLEEIRELSAWGMLDGITTTPTFFRRHGIADVDKAIAQLATEVRGEVHVEALGRDADGIVEAARHNRALGSNVVSKLPVGPASLQAAARLRELGIPCNVHLVFTTSQALLAARAGAAYVCPLMGRMRDAGLDGFTAIGEMVRVLKLHPALRTEVMVSSIRSVESAVAAMLTGAAAMTVPGRVLREMIRSPLTDGAREILARDAVSAGIVSHRMRPCEALPRLTPGAPLGQALVAMTRHAIGIAAVVSEGALVVVVTDGDVRRALLKLGLSDDIPVESVMTREPKCVAPGDPIDAAVTLMRAHRINEVIVVGERRAPVGLLSLHDLLIDEAQP